MEQTVGHITSIKPAFKWKVKDIIPKFIVCQRGDKIASPMFTLSDTTELYWQIYLHPKPPDAPQGYFGISLKSLNSVTCCLHLKFQILDDTEGKKLIPEERAKKWCQYVITPGNYAGDDRFALTDDLIDLVCGSSPRNGIIICEIAMIRKDFHKKLSLKPLVMPNNWQSEFDALDCFESILYDLKHSDVTLVAKGGEKVPAHKNFLLARSPVFKASFKSHKSDSQMIEIQIEDMDVGVLKEMLRFIYTGKVNRYDDFLDKLLNAADRYQLEGLRTLCEHRMRETLRTENSLDYLKICSDFNLTDSKELILQFIVFNGEKMGQHPYVDQLVDLDKKLFIEVLHKLLVRNDDNASSFDSLHHIKRPQYP
ncbi:hypothetical protein QAD02_009317 [Eretmocerus hayati]|uniref:Uncharacterized protein n=1 Tax=Eretmocerus hayati TaxID=131215 RepID=A0ACC2NBE9_9HYME|nr:hypothetical protein QAD02_009317 [Eretmocerus hayati]